MRVATMSDPQLSSIERSLGELRGDVRSLLRELERDRVQSRESRGRLYERIEKIEADVKIVGAVASQARDKADATAKTLAEEVKPQTDKIKALGIKGGGFLAGAALIGGLASAPAWAAIADAFQKMIK